MKKSNLSCLCILLLLGFLLSAPAPARAQNIQTQNLSNVKADDLSDAQIKAILDQIKASGQNAGDIGQILQNRGMAPEEISKLKARASALTAGSMNLQNKTDNNAAVVAQDAASDTGQMQARHAESDSINGLPVFGMDYFNGSRPDFAPDVNRPTPVNYVVGPGDQLVINVYGNSVVDWNLTVTPDGYILLPGMGKVYVGGKTIEQATVMIKDRLRAHNYAVGNGTDVAVSLANIRSIKVFINGEVQNPGTYTLSSLSTVFTALYKCGGPNLNGSLRAIKVYRDNTLLARVDAYDFIFHGDKAGDVLLRDGDIIQVPTYQVRVSIKGEIKRPAYYEMMPGESLKDLILFAGGFTSDAYTAQIKAIQLTGEQKRMKDIDASGFESFVPLKGDQYIVDKVLDRFENRVSISGSVFRPGDYELTDGLTLYDLIKKANGLKEDAYAERGYITRLNPDNTTRIIPFNVKEAASGSAEAIPLQREDIVTIPSLFDLRESYTVNIRGKVRNPGTFPYSDNMTVEDLILSAGGFAEGANTDRVIIARRVKDSDRRTKDAKLAEVIEMNIDPHLSISGKKHKLDPFDIVSVYSLPGYVKPGFVQIEGEVMFPGNYPITRKDERISDLIKEAGGFTAYAYLDGASLKRPNTFDTKGEQEKARLKREQFAQNQQAITGDSVLARQVLIDSAIDNSYVGINLSNIMKHPGKYYDLYLQDGDLITVPGLQQTVKVSGAVLSPISMVYSDRGFIDYIHRSGGFASNALRRKAYVVYANGSQAGTKNFLFFRSYPPIKPGAEIFVPEKQPREPMSFQGWVGIGTSLASLAAIIFAIARTAN